MALSVFKTFSAGEVLSASDLNSSLTNIHNNALSLISPLTGNLDGGDNEVHNVGKFGAGTSSPSTPGHFTDTGSHTNTVVRNLTVGSDTTGTPAAGIGTGMLWDSESGGENPCNVGAVDFVLSDVTDTSEDSYCAVNLRTAGAALAERFRMTQGGTSVVHVTGIIDRDVAQAEVVNTTDETTVYSFTVPGNTLSTNRGLRLTGIIDYLNNTGSPSSFTVTTTYGSTDIFTSPTFSLNQGANRRGLVLQVELHAANSASAQMAWGQIWPGALATVSGTPNSSAGSWYPAIHNSSAEDSTGDLALVVTFTHGTADASISGRMNIVQLELL